jgi:uncharacterized membrane protein
VSGRCAGEWVLPSRSAPRQTPGSGGELKLFSPVRRYFGISLDAMKGSGSENFSGRLYDRPPLRMAISAMIAALYATILVLFQYFSFGPVQVRVADLMMPLVLVFGYDGALGLSIGCLVGNYFGFAAGITVPFDVLGGPIANFVAAVVCYKLYAVFAGRGKKGLVWIQLAILAENLVVTLIVGSYLAVLIPLANDFLASAAIWYAGLFAGSLIAMNILGYMVYKMTYVGLM